MRSVAFQGMRCLYTFNAYSPGLNRLPTSDSEPPTHRPSAGQALLTCTSLLQRRELTVREPFPQGTYSAFTKDSEHMVGLSEPQ